jgi:hypothetical protein
MTTGWEPVSGSFPWPPANGTAMSSFHGSDADIRWDAPSTLNTGPSTPSTRATVSVTVSGIPAVLTAATATFTLSGAPITVGDTIEIGGVVLTSVAAAPAPDEFDGSSGDTAVVAANIAAAINDGSVGTWGIAAATSALNVISLTADTSGAVGNEVTLSSGSDRITASGSVFSGGLDPDTLTIGGQVLSAETVRTAGGMNFDVGPSNFDTAESIAAAINDTTNTLGFVAATTDGDIVLLAAFLDGTMGDGITIATTNTTALVASGTRTTGGLGVPCEGKSNSEWQILGVNVYRSDTGERGPYFRVNRIPVMTNFFRDKTDIVEVAGEVIPWDTGWIFRGSAPNQKDVWRLQTRNRPMVKKTGNAVAADSPFDVEVFIDGSRTPVAAVFGPNGQVTLNTTPVWDPSTESWVEFTAPTATSAVTINYHWERGETLVNVLDQRAKVFYRLTTVAIDTTGESPTGLVETPLGYTEPISPMNSEKFDYIWREAVRRNRWILEQGGERVKLFLRRVTGVKCDCVWDERLEEYSQQPSNSCLECYGTGWVGGYEGPIDIIIAPDDTDRRVTQTPNGRRLEHQYEVWIGPSPMLSQRDFIVKQNGERYAVGAVRRTQVRGLILQQAFAIGYLDMGDIRYRVPMGALERLPWPETRYSNPEDSPCADPQDPHPVGYDYQATPMMSEAAKIPDGREQRGRTPVWQNITYGGGGGKK